MTVTDDKIATVKYVSDDANSDGLLQNGETWVYAAASNITVTTTNTATATGTGVTATATDSMTVRVAVATAPAAPGTVPVTETGGQMPKTSSPWYGLLLLGGALASLGGLAYWRIRREGNA